MKVVNYFKVEEKRLNDAAFPYYIRRAQYFIKTRFMPVDMSKFFKAVRRAARAARAARATGPENTKEMARQRVMKKFINDLLIPDSGEYMELSIDIADFFDSMLDIYPASRIIKAFDNIDRYADLDYPENFKLLEGCSDYLGTRPDGYELLI